MRLKDPTEWMDDLTVFLDDKTLAETAAALEPTLVYGGSKAAAGAWVALTGVVAGVFGAVTLSPEIRISAFRFAAFLLGSFALLRSLHPVTVRLLGPAVTCFRDWRFSGPACLACSR
jgi:hypothetical protein